MSKEKNVAIAGATGAVGLSLLDLLKKRKFPIKNLKLLASKRSAGKKLSFKGEEVPVEELTKNSFKGVDIALFSAGSGVSKEFRQAVLDAGAVMIDNSSAFRMEEGTPLVIPEINPQAVKQHQGVIANPNCSTIIMLVPLYPLHRLNPIKRIVASTYQAASGAGALAMQELESQAKDVLEGKEVKKDVLPHQIAFNVFSHNSKVDESGYNEEELKMIRETHKIFGDENIKVTATCVRVPVLRAHSEAINVEFEKPFDPDEARKVLKSAPGLRVVDEVDTNYFPMPVEASGREEILVGRIRRDLSVENGLSLFVAGDQLWKGAALNAIQIAELLL